MALDDRGSDVGDLAAVHRECWRSSSNASSALTAFRAISIPNAYNVAAGQTPTTIATELAGQILPPGVYNSASGTFGMTGTLTLDAGDDPDAVFIFQTADGTGTLITGSTGNVSLIRSAQSCKVFWKVGSSATLGGGSTFRGTILANTSISLGAAVTVDGRLLAGEQPSGAGAVTLINDTIIKPTCAVPAATTAAATAPATTADSTTDTTTTTTTAATPTPTPTPTPTTPRSTTTSRTTPRKPPIAAALKDALLKANASAAAKARAARARARATSISKSTSTSTSTTVSRGHARPPLHHAGFTG